MHICNELSVSSFGFEGYFSSNFYPASVVSISNCVVAKADCRLLLSLIQNIDLIDKLRTAALSRTQWLAMRSHQAVQVLEVVPQSRQKTDYLQSIRLKSWLGSHDCSKGLYRKALMNKDDYDTISMRWREARQDLQRNRLNQFLSVEKSSPSVSSLYATRAQISIERSKCAPITKTRFNSTQLHGKTDVNDAPNYRDVRSRPWIAEATILTQSRKAMNPNVSANDMLRTFRCSRIASQGFSKVTCIQSFHSWICSQI
jgi:hypothetical protein